MLSPLVSPTLCGPMNCSPPGSSVHWGSPGKNARVGCRALLQGIFPTKGSYPVLLHCRRILYGLSYQGSPWILDWVAYPFSRGSSWLRNRTRVSCIAGRFFTTWATREAHWKLNKPKTIPICSGHKVTSYNWEKKKYKYVNIQWNIKQNIWQRKSDHHSLALCFQGSLEHSTILIFFIFR